MFSKKTIDFLIENKLNDSKDFFIANKVRYNEYVLDPLKKLVIDLSPYILKIDDNIITEPKIGKTISRIYRDTRFSKDKSTFREVMWITFQRVKNLYEGESAFFFEISPCGYRYGCGYYESGREAMEILRMLIDTENKVFLKAFNSYKKQKVFAIEGDKYIKSKYKGEKNEYTEWYDRKSIYFTHNCEDFDLLFSDKLAKTVGENFVLLKDIYELFKEIEKYKIRK